MTRENKDALFFDVWLVFKRAGSVRLTVREPDVARDERKMFLTVTMPKSLWTSPSLKGTITISDTDHEPSIVIDAQTVSAALRQVLGVDVDLLVHLPEPAVEQEAE